MKKPALFVLLILVLNSIAAQVLPVAPVPAANQDSVTKVSLSGVIDAAMEVVNRFEDYRELPGSITTNSGKYTISQAFLLFGEGILALYEEGDTLFTAPSDIDSPDEFYLSFEPDSLVYGIPFPQEEYVALCLRLKGDLKDVSRLPAMIPLRGSGMRTAEAIYLLASVLRHYHFFGYLPEIAQPMLTPKGLVPWELSTDKRIYTSMNSTSDKVIHTSNNWYNVGKFETFMLAKNAMGDATTAFGAAGRLHGYIRDRWLSSGYYIWVKAFGEPDYAYSQYRFNRSNSASQNDKITMLLRSAGIPSVYGAMYDDTSGKWVNADNHKPVGDPVSIPDESRFPDVIEPLSKETVLIEKINNIIAENKPEDTYRKYIWINPSDILVYGEEYILEKCKAGGISHIILTVKSSNGYLYYPKDHKMADKGFSKDLYRFDAVSELIEMAKKFDIKIVAAVSVLNDDFAHWYSGGEDRAQYFMDQSSTVHADMGRHSVTPCSEVYKQLMMDCLEEIAAIPGLSGILLGAVFMNATKYKTNTPKDLQNVPDGNPLCAAYWSDPEWQGKLLRDYAADLIQTIKVKNSNLKVILSSHPLEFSRYADFEGMQNKDLMKNLADEYLIPVAYSQWLNSGLEDYPILNPNPFSLEDYIRQVAQDCEKPVIVSLTVKDEWIYTPGFYSGLFQRMRRAGAEGFCFHEFNSLEGNPEGLQLLSNSYVSIEPNPTFNAFQYSTLAALNFKRSSLTDLSRLLVDTLEVDFGTVTLGLTGEKVIRVSNLGNKPLLLKGIYFPDSQFACETDVNQVNLPPFGSLLLRLRFSPEAPGSRSSYAILRYEGDSIRIDFHGTGRKAPVAVAGPDQQVLDATTVMLDGTGSYHSGTAALTYQWVAPGGIILSSESSATPQFEAPLVNQPTKLVFTLFVSDGETVSAGDKVTVWVYHQNKLPVAHAGPDQTVSAGVIVRLDGSASSDFERDFLTFNWTASPGITLSSTTAQNPEFLAPSVDKHTRFVFTLVVSDGKGYSQPDSVVVLVMKAGYLVPVANAGPDQTVDAGKSVMLDGSKSYDSDGDSLSFYWRLKMPDREQMSSEDFEKLPLSPMLEINIDSSGPDILRLDAVEGTRVWMCMNIKDNQYHTLNFTDKPLEDIFTRLNQSACFLFLAPPPGVYKFLIDNYYQGQLHIHSVLDSPFAKTPVFKAPPVMNDTTLVFELKVFDGAGWSAPDEVSVFIRKVDLPPVANAGPDQGVCGGELVTLDGSLSSDPEGQTLRFFWSLPPGIQLSSNGDVRPDFVAPRVDKVTYLNFQLVVSDGALLSAPTSVTITVHPTYAVSEEKTICAGSSYQGWSTTGTYQRTLRSIAGCDSVVTTQLTVLPALSFTEEVSICAGENYQGWTTTGVWQRKLQAKSGCDSLVTTVLTVHPSYAFSEEKTICAGSSYHGWPTTGTYQRTLRSIAGCDSVVTTQLTVLPALSFTEEVSICAGESYQGWTTTGVWQRKLQATSGCDSLVTTVLTVHPTYAVSEEKTICAGSSYQGWTTTGTYQRTLRSIAGCDSVVTTQLTVLPALSFTEDVTICAGESYQGWTTTGVWQRKLQATSGCDSLVTTVLTVHPSYAFSEEKTICAGSSYQGWTTTGTYQRTLRSIAGCDSVVTTQLTVLPALSFTEEVSICAGENYQGWTTTGVWQRKLQAKSGCDSLVTTVLTVHPTYQPVVAVNGDTLQVNDTFSAFQWYDSVGQIPGAVHSRYIAAKSGSYYLVVIDGNGCRQTSPVIQVIYSGLYLQAKEQLRYTVYPNPTTGQLFFRLETMAIEPIILRLLDLTGQSISTYIFTGEGTHPEASFNIAHLTKGIYFLRISSGAFHGTEKIILR
jgi:hypothetical protein